jgi:D-serine dehydratase
MGLAEALPPELLCKLQSYTPCLWLNAQRCEDAACLASLPLTTDHLEAAQAAWGAQLALLIARLWPSKCPSGAIASPLRPLTHVAAQLDAAQVHGNSWQGRLFMKMDCLLPVVGSVKARGGLFEVLSHANKLQSQGMPLDSCSVVVGSTGNLGLAVGSAAAALGMRAIVHMSSDAKEWKKQLLRQRGAQVRAGRCKGVLACWVNCLFVCLCEIQRSHYSTQVLGRRHH